MKKFLDTSLKKIAVQSWILFLGFSPCVMQVQAQEFKSPQPASIESCHAHQNAEQKSCLEAYQSQVRMAEAQYSQILATLKTKKGFPQNCESINDKYQLWQCISKSSAIAGTREFAKSFDEWRLSVGKADAAHRSCRIEAYQRFGSCSSLVTQGQVQNVEFNQQ